MRADADVLRADRDAIASDLAATRRERDEYVKACKKHVQTHYELEERFEAERDALTTALATTRAEREALRTERDRYRDEVAALAQRLEEEKARTIKLEAENAETAHWLKDETALVVKWQCLADERMEKLQQAQTDLTATLTRAAVEQVREALEKIKAVRVGPEASWTDEERYEYWSRLALEYRDLARAALAALGPGGK
jgi:chromosome segregation ATPase